ncbi:hypothetical protein EYR38_010823 [Pleurotus pulmonarius]|nr:hypothetical protein EYR38_010823 [Pleurotus pulmonarius]
MGKEKKRRRVYVHESQAPSFIATKATESRLHRAFIKAPPAAAVTEEAPLLSNAFEFALGISNNFNGEDQQEATVVDENTPTDPSGLVVKARAKRYTNSRDEADTICMDVLVANPPMRSTDASIATDIGCIVAGV